MRVKTQHPEAFLMTLQNRETFLGKFLWPLQISAWVQLTRNPSMGLCCNSLGSLLAQFSVQNHAFHLPPLWGGGVASHESERPCACFSSRFHLCAPALLSTNRAELLPGEGDNPAQATVAGRKQPAERGTEKMILTIWMRQWNGGGRAIRSC